MYDRKPIEIPHPPRSVFRYPEIDSSFAQGGQEVIRVYFLDYISYPGSGGIYVYKRGVPYPTKGFPTPESVTTNNHLKRFIRSYILLFTEKTFLISFFPFLFLPWKYKKVFIERWIHGFKKFAHVSVQPHILLDERYSVPCKALRAFITTFTHKLGIGNGHWLGLYLAHLIEFDTAYRYRMEDILSSVTKEQFLKNPRKTIRTISEEFARREAQKHIIHKFQAVCTLLRIMLCLPRFRHAFNEALTSINFNDLQMDAADHYHTLLDGGKAAGGYDWHGKTSEERVKEYNDLHVQKRSGVFPPFTFIGQLR